MYWFFRLLAKLALFFYCRKIDVQSNNNINFDKPTILASNHPNSFFDAIVIACKYPKSIYFLARGDAFKHKLVGKFLKSIHLIPIYRLSEGKENLSKNNETFDICIELLKQNKTILIFSEGICKNEWQLRPLKKGTSRLARLALNQNIDLQIVPVNINYSTFKKNPKDVILNVNKPIDFEQKNAESQFHNYFNAALRIGILTNMTIKNDIDDAALFDIKPNLFAKIILTPFAFIGFISQYWIYYIIKKIAKLKTKSTVFYDSVFFGLLMILYPIMLMLTSIITGLLTNCVVAVFVFIALPTSIFCYKKHQNI